jgi:hypothetical protein
VYTSTKLKGGTTAPSASSVTRNPKPSRLLASSVPSTPSTNPKQLRQKNVAFETLDTESKVKDAIHPKIPIKSIGPNKADNLAINEDECPENPVSKPSATVVVPVDVLIKNSPILSDIDQGGSFEDENMHNRLKVEINCIDGSENGEAKSLEGVSLESRNKEESYNSNEPVFHKDNNRNDDGQQIGVLKQVTEKQNTEQAGDEEEYSEDAQFSSSSIFSDINKGGSLEDESIYSELKPEINDIERLGDIGSKAVEEVIVKSNDTGDIGYDEDFEREGESNIENIEVDSLLEVSSSKESSTLVKEKQNFEEVEDEVVYMDDEDFEGEKEAN